MPRSRLTTILCLAVIAAAGLGGARGDVERSAFGPVVEELLSRVHAIVVPCDIVLDRSTSCFRLAPGSVAIVAEELEGMLEASVGALFRSAWRSANAVHHVELLLEDDLWGVLEVWLSEPGDGSVSGMLKYVTRRRGGGP